MRMMQILLGLAALAALSNLPAHAETADRIWTGGTILTMNDAAMRAEAVAERALDLATQAAAPVVEEPTGGTYRIRVQGLLEEDGRDLPGAMTISAVASALIAPRKVCTSCRVQSARISAARARFCLPPR